MSYLRPTCSDAAARVSNIHFSRYMPSFRQGDTHTDHHVDTGARATYEDLERLQRLPSQRPLDRRWDESRGLQFAERSHALKNHTWTPRRGIVFAGGLNHRREYATRPSRFGPIGAAKPTGQVFGSGNLPSLETPPAPTPAATLVPKGAKQEQMEKEIRDKEAKIVELKKDMDKQVSGREARITELRKQKQEVESKYRDLQIKLEELRETLDKEKDRMYRKGKKDAEKEAQEEAAQAMQSQISSLEAQRMDLTSKLESAEAQLPALRESMAREVWRREDKLAERTKKFEAEIAERYGALNKFDDLVKQNAKETKQAATETAQKLAEVSRELQLKEDGMTKRKAERGSYEGYRAHYLQVHDARRTLDDRLRILQKQLNAEIERCATTVNEDGSQQGSSQDLQALEKEVADIRERLAKVDEETKSAGHTSRILATATRYRDNSIAAESMNATLYMMSINPLRSVKHLTNTEIDDINAQMRNASNATLREELKAKKDALSAQLTTLNVVTKFAYLDQRVQTLRTLKTDSYANKASYMATLDLREDMEEASARAREGRKNMTDLSHGEWRRHRTALDKLGLLAKKQAQILEAAGQREEHEPRLDAMIDDKIADLLEDVRAKRELLFEGHKAARSASRRVGHTRAPSMPSSSPTVRKANSRPTQPVARRSFRRLTLSTTQRSTTTKSETTKQYNEDGVLKAKLVAELCDPAITMDAQTRAEKVKQGLTAYLRTLEYQIERMDAKLMAPMTRSDSMRKTEFQNCLESMKESHARAKGFLETGFDPWASQRQIRANRFATKETSKSASDHLKSASDLLPKRPDVDVIDELSSLSVIQKEAKLGRLKALKKSYPRDKETPSLDQQIQHLSLSVSKTHLANLLAKRDALMPETDANRTTIETLDREIARQQKTTQLVAAGLTKKQRTRTRRQRMAQQASRTSYEPFPGSDTTLPETTGLNLTPTSAKQAAHSSHMGLCFSHGISWVIALRQNRLPGGLTQHRRSFMSSAQEESSSTHTSDFFDHGEHVVHGHRSGDFAAASPDKHVADDISGTTREAASDDDNAKNYMQPALASLSSSTSSHPSTNNTPLPISAMAESEEETLPAYEIPLKDKRNALIASRNSTASFWKYSMYKNAAGEAPTRHYCTTFEQTEAQLAKFAGEKVVGFDLEWEKFKSKPGEDSAKRCVSLVQIASEDKVALFHLALFRGGDSTAALMPPALRSFLENPDIIKVGVNIGGDASRLKRCFGVEMRGNIELSHLYKLVTYGETNPAKVNRGLFALANQVKEVLHLPLSKGEVRTSSWSKRLNDQQTEYAASDAYAGLRLFYELERRRRAMKSKPPRPAFHELGLPILLGGDQTAPSKPEPLETTEDTLDESAALQEQDQDDDSDNFDTPEDLEALDAYLESQDAMALGSTSLPEITYPTLPPLEDFPSGPSSSFDSTSSLPEDPLTKPTRKPKTSTPRSTATTSASTTPTFPSPEAATADSWSATWQSQLPATHTVRVSKQALRAYHIWHHQGFTLEETAALLRKDSPLALSTVVTYIAEALQKEGLEFDAVKVVQIRERLPISVRGRYGRVYAKAGDAEASA